MEWKEETWTDMVSGFPIMDPENKLFLWDLQPAAADAALEALEELDPFHALKIAVTFGVISSKIKVTPKNAPRFLLLLFAVTFLFAVIWAFPPKSW